MSSSKDGGALPKAERREALAQPPNLVRSSRTRPSSTVISDDSTDESEYHDAPHVLDDNEAEGSDEAGENSDKEAQHVSPKHTAYYTDSSEDSKSDRHVHYDEYESLYELVLENEDIRNTIRAMASHIEDDNNIRYRRYSRGEKSARRVVEGHEKKRMFICCDGTWQNASGTVTPMTNVAKLARAVDRLGCDPYMPESRGGPANERGSQHRTHIGLVRQIVYYSSGIGGQSALHIERGYSGLTGKGLTSNILNAYCFICNNFNFASKLDEIILVGFSRGAFTVRCLANFIDKVGLLRRKGLPFLRTLFDSWKQWGRADGDKKMRLERELNQKLEALADLCIRAKIKILAEWDCVSAIGVPLGIWQEKFSFVNVEVPESVQSAIFALALDEKRRTFKPRQWTARASDYTKIDQCAFVGCHSDIGGGNFDVGLSTVSLIWMVSKIKERSAAEFDEKSLLQFMFPFRHARSLLRRKGNIAGKTSSWFAYGKPRIELKNFSGTKGLIHESLTGLWRIPWALSFGTLHGKRDDILPRGKEEFKVKVHFTVALLRQMSNCRLNKKYLYIDGRDCWEDKKDNSIALKEADISDLEHMLLEKWINLSKSFKSQAEGGLPVENDDDVNWTRVARNLHWAEPDGKAEDGALIVKISDKIGVSMSESDSDDDRERMRSYRSADA